MKFTHTFDLRSLPQHTRSLKCTLSQMLTLSNALSPARTHSLASPCSLSLVLCTFIQYGGARALSRWLSLESLRSALLLYVVRAFASRDRLKWRQCLRCSRSYNAAAKLRQLRLRSRQRWLQSIAFHCQAFPCRACSLSLSLSCALSSRA